MWPRRDHITATGSGQAENVLAFAGRFAQRGGGMREILDVDARQRGGEGVLGLPQRRHHHLVEQHGAGERRAVHVVGRAGGTQNIVRRDAALLARELVAAARPARALEDAVAHQCLQHRLEMPRRQAMARRQRFGRDRPPARVERDVDDGGDGQGAFAGQKRHEIPQDWRNGAKLVRPSFSSRARRTKTPNSACCFIKICDFADRGLQGCYQHQLCNARAALDRERVVAEIRKDYLNFAAVIGIERARRIEHRDAVVQREPRARPDLALNPCGQRDREAGRDRGASTRRDDDGRVRGHRGHEVEPGRVRALIGRERQVGGVRKPHDAKFDFVHRLAPASVSAMRATSARATSSFDCGGQDSTPCAVTKCTVLRSPPMAPPSAETSLARIQSQPLRASLALACSMMCSVSAAKPMTRRGRLRASWATVARMSGFSVSASFGDPPAPFLILFACGLAMRQSATAAANTATSAGSAFVTTASMSCAVLTLTTVTPGGSGTLTGPETSVTSAPAAAAAAAMAWPCLPEERLAM